MATLLKKLLIGVMILVGCIGFTMNANAEWPLIQKTFFDDFGNCIYFLDKNLDGAGDTAVVWLWYPDQQQYVLYGTTTYEIGEKIRLDAIEMDRNAKLKNKGGIVI